MSWLPERYRWNGIVTMTDILEAMVVLGLCVAFGMLAGVVAAGYLRYVS